MKRSAVAIAPDTSDWSLKKTAPLVESKTLSFRDLEVLWDFSELFKDTHRVLWNTVCVRKTIDEFQVEHHYCTAIVELL